MEEGKTPRSYISDLVLSALAGFAVEHVVVGYTS
jgi:hypothetical protein